jgi:putative MATE family efflux protein
MTWLIISFSVPLLLGNIFQIFYSLADTRIVGQFLGEGALAAVGATSSLNSVIIGFLNGLTNGFALLTARFFGAGDSRRMRKTIAHSIVMGMLTAVVLTAASLIVLKPTLAALNTPESIMHDAKSYIAIILGGMIVTALYNLCAASLRAVGDTVSPLIILIISTIVNIILDVIFILVFKMGVSGAAVATIISQTISAVLCVIYIIRKHPELVPKKEDFRFDKRLAADMYVQGASMGLMISIVGIGTLIMQGAVNSFGETTIVAHTTARKLTEIYMLPISIFGTASATISGQNYGAGRIDRVKECVIKTTLIAWVWSALVIVLTAFATGQLSHLITGIENKEVTATVVRYMKINTACYFILSIVIVFRNALQGVGAKAAPLLSSVLELLGKFAVAKVLAPLLGYFGIIISEPVVWTGMAIILGIGFFTSGALKLKTSAESRALTD